MNDCVERNFELRNYFKKSRVHVDRTKMLKKFIGRNKSVVDVGCGAYKPVELKIQHACDIDKRAWKFLKKIGWKGKFKEASVANLPYKDKEFRFAICSEVIEHLRNKKDVRKAFEELDRISMKWLITTPSAYDNDPDHTFHFGYNNDNLFDMIPSRIDCLVVRRGYYYYISNDKKLLCKITEVKNG